ncbi:hypothetical protein C884_01655 [Kocuria palustris PEL]|uniref:Uncharacterized protein n=1 Tax=Kocuria palustris PEL TaxID=1236550 RepID=M2XRW9_9MICC|nr:hypothetical protein C884_01655 [Kocuria palustris PEL]
MGFSVRGRVTGTGASVRGAERAPSSDSWAGAGAAREHRRPWAADPEGPPPTGVRSLSPLSERLLDQSRCAAQKEA